MASNNEAPREIYAGFSDDVISNFLFQRQFYQPDGSQQQLLRQQHEIEAPTTTAGREQEEEFSGSPDNENTNKEEGNSFVVNSLKLLWGQGCTFSYTTPPVAASGFPLQKQYCLIVHISCS